MAFLETLHPAGQAPAREAVSRRWIRSTSVRPHVSGSSWRSAFVVAPDPPYARSDRSGTCLFAGLVSATECAAELCYRCGGSIAFISGVVLLWVAVASPLAGSGPSTPDGPHGAAPSPDDRSGPVDSAGSAGHRAVARSPAALHSTRFGTASAMPAGARLRTHRHSSCVLLARVHGGRDRMACSRPIRTGDAVGRVAQGRTRVLSRSRPSILVARSPAVAEPRKVAPAGAFPCTCSWLRCPAMRSRHFLLFVTVLSTRTTRPRVSSSIFHLWPTRSVPAH